MNAAGEAQHQALARHQAAGAATQQATVDAKEQYVLGMLRMLHAKAGHHQEQV